MSTIYGTTRDPKGLAEAIVTKAEFKTSGALSGYYLGRARE